MQQGYVTFGQIQQHILNVRRSEKRAIGFRDAALELYRMGRYSEQPPVSPDFAKWDLQDMEQFKALAWDMVVRVSPQSLPEPPRRRIATVQNPDAVMLELRRSLAPVRISIESVGSPPVFTGLPEHFVVLYALKGSCILHTKDGCYPLEAEQLIILAPGVPYYLECTPEDLVLDIIATKERFERYFLDVIPQGTPLHGFFYRALYASKEEYLRFMLPYSAALMRIVQNLFVESIAREKPYAEEAFLYWLQLFFVQLLRTPQLLPEPGKQRTNPDRRALVTAILQHIQHHYASLTLEGLAEAFHYNPAYLSRLIRRETGRTMTQLLSDCRMEAARNLLRNTALPVDQIAEQVGYNSADHFTAMFRRANGMPPSSWRSDLLQEAATNPEK